MHLRHLAPPLFSISFSNGSEIRLLWLQPQARYFRNDHWSLLISILFCSFSIPALRVCVPSVVATQRSCDSTPVVTQRSYRGCTVARAAYPFFYPFLVLCCFVTKPSYAFFYPFSTHFSTHFLFISSCLLQLLSFRPLQLSVCRNHPLEEASRSIVLVLDLFNFEPVWCPAAIWPARLLEK